MLWLPVVFMGILGVGKSVYVSCVFYWALFLHLPLSYCVVLIGIYNYIICI